jgi:hypothetical protein
MYVRKFRCFDVNPRPLLYGRRALCQKEYYSVTIQSLPKGYASLQPFSDEMGGQVGSQTDEKRET